MWMGNGWCGWIARGIRMNLGDSGGISAWESVVVLKHWDRVRRDCRCTRKEQEASITLGGMLQLMWPRTVHRWNKFKGRRAEDGVLMYCRGGLVDY